MTTVTKTVREVYEALARNGFEHLRGSWYYEFSNEKFGGCVLAQAAFNLGVLATSDETSYFGIGDYLDDVWDERVYTIYDALNQLEVSRDSKWFAIDSESAKAGQHIIHWNDLTLLDGNGDPTDEYVLKTYKEVADMAYDILEPHFDKEVVLTVYDYSPYFKVVA